MNKRKDVVNELPEMDNHILRPTWGAADKARPSEMLATITMDLRGKFHIFVIAKKIGIVNDLDHAKRLVRDVLKFKPVWSQNTGATLFMKTY